MNPEGDISVTWTSALEHKLLSLRAVGLTTPEIAVNLVLETGEIVTEDMVRNKLKRIDERTRLADEAPVASSDDPLFEIPAVPSETFVGINSVFWDLETTGLTAIMGRLLCCSFADSFGQVKTFGIVDFPGSTPIDDRRLAVAIRDELEKADHWITWNGKLYDVPFLNARLLKAGQRPLRTDILHTDLMYYSKGQFLRIGSSKLENVSKFIRSGHQKTGLDWDTWALAGLGDEPSMTQVVNHCEADVLTTRDVFAVLKPHVRNIHR